MINKIKAETSALQIVVAIIVLLIVALALLSLSTGSISDLGSKVKSVINAVFGGSSTTNDNGGAIDQIIEKSTQGYG